MKYLPDLALKVKVNRVNEPRGLVQIKAIASLKVALRLLIMRKALMSLMDSMWCVAEVCMVIVYLCAVLVAIQHLWRSRQDCFDCTSGRGLIRSGLLAFLVTPSLLSNFFFALPCPAAFGLALLAPGVVFASGHRMDILWMMALLYILPLMVCTAVIFYVWRFIRWTRVTRQTGGS